MVDILIQQFITAIAVVGNIALGIIILARDKKSATGILFFLFAFTNAAASISNYLSLNSVSSQSTLFWIRMVMFCAAFMGLFFYLFASTFPSKTILMKRFWFYLLIILYGTLLFTCRVFNFYVKNWRFSTKIYILRS